MSDIRDRSSTGASVTLIIIKAKVSTQVKGALLEPSPVRKGARCGDRGSKGSGMRRDGVEVERKAW